LNINHREVRMASYQPIKEWPEEDRPREKLLSKGSQALSETELLAIILRNGNASTGQSAIDHARLLLHRFADSKASTTRRWANSGRRASDRKSRSSSLP
jgi:hypothetical protein